MRHRRVTKPTNLCCLSVTGRWDSPRRLNSVTSRLAGVEGWAVMVPWSAYGWRLTKLSSKSTKDEEDSALLLSTVL